jgi:hypothetical protein
MKFQNNKGLKGSHDGVKMMLKKSSGDPKLCYYSENYYVTVLLCSLIRGGEVVCRQPDSLVSRAAVRYSEGPRFESRSGFTLTFFFKWRCFSHYSWRTKYLVSKVCKGSFGILFRETSDDSNSVELLTECKCCIVL